MSRPSRFLVVLTLVSFIFAGCQPVSTPVPTIAPTVSIQPTPVPSLAAVTYVGNSGFLIKVGDKKVLIDSLFEGFPGTYHIPSAEMDDLLNAVPPFDHVDLVLATHTHADHFSEQLVKQYLEKNPGTVFASTAQATALVTGFGDRVITLDAKTGAPAEADVNGIHVEAIYLSHGVPTDGSAEVINNAYLVTVGGVVFFHSGDIDPSLFQSENLQTYDMTGKHIDFAFMQHFLLSNPAFRGFMGDVLKSKYVIASHYELTDPVNAEKIKEYYPGAVIFTKELQTWDLPQE